MTEYKRIYLEDYRPYEYEIPKVDLEIDFFEDYTIVKSKFEIVKKSSVEGFPPLVLKGEELETLNILIGDKEAGKDEYEINDIELKIFPVKDKFLVTTISKIYPEKNTSLEGIYKSDGLFCSQCEAEGFRRIAWHPDRPDVLSQFTCRVSGDKKNYPVLLSNGNPVEKGDLPEGRHFVKWHDPFPKPSYLFAVVAGDLYCVEDSYTTMSGREIALKIYTEPENRNKCFHAMESLKKAMKWDEDVFSREYDLDIYMIVAVRAFNMGAMENKGLNIFNSTYVLADNKTGTDDDFLNIESVVSHEYFHNWTGNRITLANWFQLSLKEGLTVFRDQLFSSEVGPGSVSRIRDVKVLKARQFSEDAGPFAHPVRPESYIEMNNFYTATVYEKGAEIVRMIYNLLGRERFLKGMDTYFKEFDSMAVTCEDLISAVSRGGEEDLWEFMRWYEQSGTPVVRFKFDFDSEKNILTATITQETPETPGQKEKIPVPVPVKVAFFEKSGKPIEFRTGDDKELKKENVILLNESEVRFSFGHFEEEPVASLFRGFSAPVRFDAGKGIERDIFLMANDTDPFNRWDASRKVLFSNIIKFYNGFTNGVVPEFPNEVSGAFASLFAGDEKDKALIAEIISLPTEFEVIQEIMNSGILVDPQKACKARSFFIDSLALEFKDEFLNIFNENSVEKYIYSSEEIAKRSLKNAALFYVSKSIDSDFIYDVFKRSDNMTDTIAALKSIVCFEDNNSGKALQDFYETWKNDLVVMDKWFAVQSASTGKNTFENVKMLMNDPVFSIKNPNKVRSLISVFANNSGQFHREDGKGYEFVSDIIIDFSRINPQVGARLVTCLSNWRGFEKNTGEMMKAGLEKIFSVNGLARDIYEMVARALDRS